jgi:hypothetical protein
MRTARWTPKSTNTHSEYEILTAFPQQQWLYERASALRYTYIACLDNNKYTTRESSLYDVPCKSFYIPVYGFVIPRWLQNVFLPMSCVIFFATNSTDTVCPTRYRTRHFFHVMSTAIPGEVWRPTSAEQVQHLGLVEETVNLGYFFGRAYRWSTKNDCRVRLRVGHPV